MPVQASGIDGKLWAQDIRKPPTPDQLSPPQGSAAISPGTKGTPAFTEDDVRQYVSKHRLPNESKKLDFKITSIRFISSKEVSVLLNGASTGFPDDYPLCYVELSGTFTFSGPKGASATYPRGIEIFDAHTGNLIITGGLP